ncbi:MAG TPA: hypothetical protein VGG27_09240 [Magnetospirillaceae bacterium]
MTGESYINAAFLRDEIARLSEMIGTARQMIAIGDPVDLEPVGEGVAALCSVVAKLPQDQSVALREDLEALNIRLDRLGNDIQARIAANDQPNFEMPDR